MFNFIVVFGTKFTKILVNVIELEINIMFNFVIEIICENGFVAKRIKRLEYCSEYFLMLHLGLIMLYCDSFSFFLNLFKCISVDFIKS